MTIRNRARKITQTFLLAILLFSVNVTTVFADKCVGKGPYGICTPDTDIEISSVPLLDNGVIMGALFVFAIGFAFLLSGSILKARASE